MGNVKFLDSFRGKVEEIKRLRYNKSINQGESKITMDRNDESKQQFDAAPQADQPVEAQNQQMPTDAELSQPVVMHKYTDRSGEASAQEESVSEGVVWHGPAYTPEDDEEERRRVRAIIEQNAPISDPETEGEEEPAAEAKKRPFWKKTWFWLTCAALVLAIAAVFILYPHFSASDQPQEPDVGEDSPDTDGTSQENSGPMFANLADKTEDEVRAESFPRAEAYPTPDEFFTAKTAFTDYTYYYLYVNGTFSGYDAYAGTNYAIIDTAMGKIALLDAMFTLPEFEEGDTFYFYYLYIGYDANLDAVFGAYVDHSVENEGRQQVQAYTDGTYTVGEDLDTGEYFFYPTASTASIQIYGDEKYIEKILSESFSGGYFLTLEDGEVLIVKDAQFTSSASVELSAGATLYAYMYRVGTDIEPGTYRLTSDGVAQACYVVYDSSDARQRQVLATDEFSGQIVIEVEQGQYLHLIHCYGASYTPPESEDEASEEEEDPSPEDNSANE